MAADPRFGPSQLRTLNARFAEQPPRALLRWSVDTFGADAVMGTGFGCSGVALMHLLAQVHPTATVFYLDTELLFPETYDLRDQLTERFALHFEQVTPEHSLEQQEEEHGAQLWQHDPDHCCFLRKVRPLRRYLSDKGAWITALRRDQSPARASTKLLEWDATCEVVKLNPLAAWTEEQVWAHIRQHELPYNSLHDEGYRSIGCIPCTAPVEAQAPKRAGRWTGHEKNECGLHQ